MADSLQGNLDLVILKTLQLGPNHGFGITLHIQTASQGLLRVEEGSLSPALHRLERDKLNGTGSAHAQHDKIRHPHQRERPRGH